MTDSEINTAQADWAGLAQGAGHSPCDNTTGDRNRRHYFKDQNNTGSQPFVPISSRKSGAADVKAIAARRDRDQNQGQNGSQGDGQKSDKIVQKPSEQINGKANATASVRSNARQNISNAVTDRNDGLAEKLATVKAQIADLLDRIEASQPGFAKAVAPKVERDSLASGPVAKSDISDKQALLAALQEVAGLLEELLELLKNNDADNTGGNGQTVMEAVAPGYAPASSSSEVQSAEEMFMSIYDQLSAETQQEVVEILAVLAFERQEIDDGLTNTTASTPSGINTASSDFSNGFSQPVDGTNDNSVTDDGVTADALRENPEILSQAGIQGVEVTGMDLFTDSDGMLSEESKIEVNKLISYLSDLMGRIEVVANVYVEDSGNIGVHLTSGDENSAVFYTMEGTIYSPHVHTNGSWTPSILDRENEIPGAEDAIVTGDGVAGNETGDYFQYA
ncbi:MAG: hypothetical protein PVJ19_06220 [Desulfobacteraceae bacterium]|jgi:hypothetical protein